MNPMEPSETQRAFILHWGEMGSKWGINRAVAQVHALLLVSDKPLQAQEICESLSLARSNVSTSLKELQSWGIIKLIHVMGDRREHFEADKDIWKVLSKIADKRIELEIIPTISILKSLEQQRDAQGNFKKLLKDFVEIFESGVSFYQRIRALPIPIVRRLLKLDRKLAQFLDGKE